MGELVVPRRFCGPPSSGNGGWTAGALAAHVESDAPGAQAEAWPGIAVSLRRPPPLDVRDGGPTHDGVTTATDGEHPVAHAELAQAELTVVEPVSAAEAAGGRGGLPRALLPPLPDLLRVRHRSRGRRRAADLPGPGRRPGRRRADGRDLDARPEPRRRGRSDTDGPARASLPATWAALDCVGGWAGDLEERLMVLGRMTARVDALPVVGEEHVVVGRRRGSEGRKTLTAAPCTTPTGGSWPAPSTPGSPSTPPPSAEARSLGWRHGFERSNDDRRPEWWRDAVIYQIYVRSFADANGDGVGDLRRHHLAAALPARPRRRRGLDHAVLHLAAARPRLRRRRLPRRRPALRHARRLRRPARRRRTTSASR